MKKLIKLEQPGCSPCISVSEFLDQEGVDYQKIDVTKEPEVAVKYGIMGVPWVFLLDDEGNVVGKSRGYNRPELEELIAKLNQ